MSDIPPGTPNDLHAGGAAGMTSTAVTDIADPIVEEVRAIRDAYARSLNYDLAAIVADLQARQTEHANLVVNLPPKHIKDT
jgi:beta-phosphoglucomutase-like phosphatase (HAD superfamily)